MAKKKLITFKEKREIFYYIINALIGAVLVFIGAFADGNLTRSEIFATFAASCVLGLTKFKEYWESEKDDWSNKVYKVTNFV